MGYTLTYEDAVAEQARRRRPKATRDASAIPADVNRRLTGADLADAIELLAPKAPAKKAPAKKAPAKRPLKARITPEDFAKKAGADAATAAHGPLSALTAAGKKRWWNTYRKAKATNLAELLANA